MKACLNNLEMFCSKGKLIGLILKQQNDKSSQIYPRKLWIGGLTITVTMGKVCYQGQQLQNHRIFT